VAIHVAVMANPDFAAAASLMGMITDGLYGRGAAARVEQGLGVWEDVYAAGASDVEAREAVAAWLAEQQQVVTVAGEEVESEG
jgi:hypothetical protein